jgi:translation elongation factor EF-1beta
LILIVDNDKISIDELNDQIESWENEVQSVDILSFKNCKNNIFLFNFQS